MGGFFGWGGRIRTLDKQDQNLLPYHLATPHRVAQFSESWLDCPSWGPAVRYWLFLGVNPNSSTLSKSGRTVVASPRSILEMARCPVDVS